MNVSHHNSSRTAEPSATEGTRRVTGVAEGSAKNSTTTPPNPEVEAKGAKRVFSKSYKLNILDQWDHCTKPGDKSAILRREGLYSQVVDNWRKQRSQGKLSVAPRQINLTIEDPALKKRLMLLEIENERLHKKLDHAQKIIDIQKKLSELLQIPLQTIDDQL